MVGVSGGDAGSAAVSGVSRWATLRSGVDGRRRKCLFLAIGEHWEMSGARDGGVDGVHPGSVPVSNGSWGGFTAVERRTVPELNEELDSTDSISRSEGEREKKSRREKYQNAGNEIDSPVACRCGVAVVCRRCCAVCAAAVLCVGAGVNPNCSATKW